MCLVFCSVPYNLITSASLSPANPNGTVGSSVNLTCKAVLCVDVTGAMIGFDYRLDNVSVHTVSGTTLTSTATISPVTISSAGSYTCTVNVTASGVCGAGSGHVCPTNTSDPVPLTVQCEW